MTAFYFTVKSEWLKQRRSSSQSLILLGGLFLPAILLVARLSRPANLPALYADARFWHKLWNMAWPATAHMVLPIVIFLVTSLIVQLEYRNNMWKQVHASPQTLPALFFARLLIILGAVLGFFVVLCLGLYTITLVPLLFFRQIDYPQGPLPLGFFALQSLRYFIDILPIVALQYLLSLHFKNFMIPLGVGMAQWLVVIGCLSWKYLYIFPYSYLSLDFESTHELHRVSTPPADYPVLALGYFVVITIVSLILYTSKKERG